MATRILILGGGFAGLEAARRLGRSRDSRHLSVKLVNSRRWSLFAPLLADVISGRIDPNHIAYPLEPFCRRHGVEFAHAAVTSIDPARKTVQTAEGRLEADFVIIALGCETNYYGHGDFVPHAPGLKTLVEGVEIRMKARNLLEARAGDEDRTGHIIVCGAGYTGFETASHMALYIRHLTRLPYGRMRRHMRILLLEEQDRVLKNTTEQVQNWAMQLIDRFGVEVRTRISVKGFPSPGTVELTDGTVLSDAMVVWTAGVTPGAACKAMDVAKTKGGRLEVDEFLRLPKYEGVYAAGDVAGPGIPGRDKPLRMSVQFSLMGGRCAADNVLHAIDGTQPRVYAPIDPGFVVPLGPGQAMGVVLGRQMHGRIPFMLHYFMSVYRSWGLANRFGVMTDLFRELLPYPNMSVKQQRADQVHEPFKGGDI
jgi:NADH:ubiquinone reductase (H+-translocating)